MTGVTRESSATATAHPRSHSGEPWDEQQPGSSATGSNTAAMSNAKNNIDNYSTMRRDLTYTYNEQELEDGDLPTLSLSQSRSGINGTTAAAASAQQQSNNLRSPSQEAEIKKQKEFWKQLDCPSSASKGGEDGPDDEMGARRAEAREDARNKGRSKKSGKKNRGVNGNGDHMEQLRSAESDESDDDSRDSKEYVVGEHDETNFCDNTLIAMEAICGDTGLQVCLGAPQNSNNNKNGTMSNPNLNQPRKAKNLNILNANNRENGDSVDEHTAIEVEYVEPPTQEPTGLEKERPENWSPTRKNAYLAAMARKAKEDFEKSQGNRDSRSVGGSSIKSSKSNNKSATTTPAAAAESEDNSPEDVYNSLNAAEKRKFLRFINSGVSPTESAQRVKAERSAGDSINNNNNNSKAKEGKSKKGKLFGKFWKKGSKSSKEPKESEAPAETAVAVAAVVATAAAAATAVVATTAPPTPSPQEEEKPRDKEGFPVMESNAMFVQEEKKEDDLRPISVEHPSYTHGTLSDDDDDESTFQGLSRDPTQESEPLPSQSHSLSMSGESEREINVDPMVAAAAVTAAGLASAAVGRSMDRSSERSDTSQSGAKVVTATSLMSGSTNEEEEIHVRPSPDKSNAVRSPEQQHELASSTPRATSDPAEDSPQRDSPAFDDRFAKSGINYYDAVRRQLSESDDETNFSSSAAGAPASKGKAYSRATRLGPILQSPKLKGFSKLSKGGKGSAQKTATPSPSTHRTVTAVTPDTAVASEWSYQEQEKLGIVTPSTAGRTDVDRAEFSVQDEEENSEIAVSRDASNFSPPALTPEYSPAAQKNATSDSTANILVDEEEVLGRVEKELLRPVSKFTSPTPTVLESAFEKERTTPKGEHAPEMPPKDDLDFDMQEYLNSTDVYSSGIQANDNMSVTSGTTAETSLYGGGSTFTLSTTMTQSSRKRRPGAAKTRLAKAKEAEKQASKNGWHESIRAAAQTNKREWQPKVGWVDYEVPEKDMNITDLSTSNVSSEKMHLNLSLGQTSKRSEGEALEDSDRSGEECGASVPFPSKWEQERSLMVQEQTPGSVDPPESFVERQNPEIKNHEVPMHPEQSSEAHDNALPLSLDDMSVEQSVAHSVDQFVQSVGASSPPRKRAVASPMRTTRAAHSPSKRSGWVDSMQAATANIASDNQSWDPMNGWANLDAAASPRNPGTDSFESPSARFGQPTIEERQNEMSERMDSASPSSDQPVELSAPTTREPANNPSDNGFNMNAAPPSPRGETPDQDSAVYEKYSSKEIKSTKAYKDYGPQRFANKDVKSTAGYADYGPQIAKNGNNDFPADNLNKAATVNVVKQKVDEEDFNWFPQTRRGSSTVWTENTQEGLNTSAQKSVASSSKSSRRSRGPVDVDEAENLSDDSEEEEGVVWNGVVFETGSPVRNGNGVLNKTTEASTKSGSSSASLSSFSKMVPKLSQSKRDTSPIRAGRNPDPAGGAVSPPRVKSLATGIAPVEQSQAVHFEPSQNVGILPLDTDDVSATSSTVKKRLQEWESRVPREEHYSEQPRPSGEANRLNSATAEWKSFLGKKVQAESAAAAERHVGGEPQVRNAGDQNDSLFEFSVTDGGTSVGSPNRSGAGLNRLDRPANQYAYANDSANAPPSTAGSDFSDGNEINKTFLGRLASCAAPMVPQRIQNGSADALAHLAFLRTNNQQEGKPRFMPPHLCGRPEVILEEGDSEEHRDHQRTAEAKVAQSMSDIKSKGSDLKGDTRSVISEDFGAKTAYLEALAMKTAVSKPSKRSGSRGRGSRSSAASDISSGSTKSHKEKWREFLDKKQRASASPAKIRGNTSDASAAAETYAAKKVEEMMAAMSSRSKSTPRSWRGADQADEDKSRVVESMIREHTRSSGDNRTVYDLTNQGVGGQNQPGAQAGPGRKTDSLVAAEQLASARVNAMMQALANDSAAVEEGEI